MSSQVCPRLLLSVLALSLVSDLAQATPIKDNGSLRELLELMADRLELAEEVAKYKWERRVAPDDDKLDPSTNDAAIFKSAVAIDAKFINSFHQAQIEAFKARQRQLFVSWKTAGTDGFDQVEDAIATARSELEKNAREEISKIAQLQEACAPLSASQINDAAAPILRRRSIDKALFKPMLDSLEVLAREDSPGCKVNKVR